MPYIFIVLVILLVLIVLFFINHKSVISYDNAWVRLVQNKTVKDADKIIVLDNGNMVGLGKHEELLKSCKVYKEIYDLQNSGVTE